MNVLIFGVDYDFRVSYRILLCLVDPGVQGRDVDVLDLLSGLNRVMKFDGIGASTEEGVSGFKRFNDFKRVEKLLEVWISFDVSVPVALPLDLEKVALSPEKFVFLQRGFVDLLQRTVRVTDGISVALDGKTVRAPVP